MPRPRGARGAAAQRAAGAAPLPRRRGRRGRGSRDPARHRQVAARLRAQIKKTLDAVDRHRNRMLLGLGIAIAFLTAVLIPSLMGAMHGHSNNNAQAILAHYFILLIWV